MSRHVARQLERAADRPSIIYAYDHCALDCFKVASRCGVRKIYDLPIGHWRAFATLLHTELELFPEWRGAASVTDFGTATYRRKDEEVALADQIIVASTFTKKTLLASFPELADRILVVPYGAPRSSSHRKGSDASKPLKVLFAGSLDLRKGIHYVAEATRRLGRLVEVTVVGARRTECKPLDEFLAHTRWVPSLPHGAMLALMRQQDVLLFPSLFEGYGLVITEAMSQGCVVVTTDRTIGGDIIDNWSNGVLVPAGSSAAIADVLARLHFDRDLLAAISLSGQRWCDNHGWSRYRQALRIAVGAESSDTGFGGAVRWGAT